MLRRLGPARILTRSCAAKALALTVQKRRGAMSIVLVILIGLGAGAVARLLMSANAPGAWAACAALGVAGALTAYAIAHAAGWSGDPGDRLAMHSAAIGGLGLLAMYRMTRHDP